MEQIKLQVRSKEVNGFYAVTNVATADAHAGETFYEEIQTIERAKRFVKCWNSHDKLVEALEKGPAPNVFSQFADFAEECMTKPSMAVYKGHFSGLAIFLRSCVSRSEEALQALAKAKEVI